ncbi:MAG: hypothetical protein IPM33_04910 [Phycisphaerales bacterium]|nr:hypothetical protein [Phycisphaerales bacterium]
MGAEPIDRHAARRYARMAQVGGLVVLVGGVVAGALVLPEPTGQAVELASSLPDAPVVTEQPTQAPMVDLRGTVERLALIRNNPVEPVVAVSGPGEGLPPAPPPPPVRYLGPVGMGQTVLMGLVDDGGRQRFVGVGDSTTGGRVRRIEATAITLVEGEVEKTIELNARGMEIVTRTGAARSIPPIRFSNAESAVMTPETMKVSRTQVGGPEYEAIRMRLFNEAIEKLQNQGHQYDEGVLKRMAEHWANESVRHQLGLGAEPPPDPEKLTPEMFKEGGGKGDQ